MARSGALDGALISTGRFYQTNFTKALLFLSDGTYLANLAAQGEPARQPVGNDERDRQLPRPAWLWLYTFWYQMPPFTTSATPTRRSGRSWRSSRSPRLHPLHPGVRSLPRLRVYRLIWRDYYRTAKQTPDSTPGPVGLGEPRGPDPDAGENAP